MVKDSQIVVKSKFEFWHKVFQFLNAFALKKLTDKEMEIMCHAMLSNSKNPFSGISLKKIRDAINVVPATINMHKYNLKDKGWLTEEGELSPLISNLKKQLQDSDQPVFQVLLKIALHE